MLVGDRSPTGRKVAMSIPDWLPIATGLAGAVGGGWLGHHWTESRNRRERRRDRLAALEEAIHTVNAILKRGAWDTAQDVAHQNVRDAQEHWRTSWKRAHPWISQATAEDLVDRLNSVETVLTAAVNMADGADHLGRTWPQLIPDWAVLRDRALSNAACSLAAEIQGDPLPDNAMISGERWASLRARTIVGRTDHLADAAREAAALPDPPVSLA
jgi:hypothetical protein